MKISSSKTSAKLIIPILMLLKRTREVGAVRTGDDMLTGLISVVLNTLLKLYTPIFVYL